VTLGTPVVHCSRGWCHVLLSFDGRLLSSLIVMFMTRISSTSIELHAKSRARSAKYDQLRCTKKRVVYMTCKLLLYTTKSPVITMPRLRAVSVALSLSSSRIAGML
jgi:hypothetical protein